jgi:cytochrome c oxidase assembly protein subunit 15
MVGGIFYEHGHRMVATFVGFLTLVQFFLFLKFEPRKWVRVLSGVCLIAVIVQGILGGITVLFFLPTPVSVTHATLAQAYFTLLVILSFVTSGEWSESNTTEISRRSYTPIVFSVVVFSQLVIGALMRHTGSGLAVPDFPLFYGELLPAYESLVNSFHIVVHSLHRFTGFFIFFLSILLFNKMYNHYRNDSRIFPLSTLIVFLVISQIFLVALSVCTAKHPVVASVHLITAALILSLSVILNVKLFRFYKTPMEAEKSVKLKEATA